MAISLRPLSLLNLPQNLGGPTNNSQHYRQKVKPWAQRVAPRIKCRSELARTAICLRERLACFYDFGRYVGRIAFWPGARWLGTSDVKDKKTWQEPICRVA